LTAEARYAGFATRVVALAIDAALISVIAVLVGVGFALVAQVVSIDADQFSTLDAVLASIGYLVLAGIYLISFWTLSGKTPGMSFMGLRVVRPDGSPIGFVRAVRRLAGVYLAALPLGAGFLLILVDDRRRGLQDVIGGTVVVHDPFTRRGRER
jgi:uncharacterized RDD family membrane protein YckC